LRRTRACGKKLKTHEVIVIRDRALRGDSSVARDHRRHQTYRRLAGVLLAAATGVAARPCCAYDVMLRWTTPANATGYRLHIGSRSGSYAQDKDLGLLPGSTFDGVVHYVYSGMPFLATEYVAVTAYNAGGESTYSNEKVFNYAVVTPPQVDAGPDKTGPVGDSLTLGSDSQSGVSYFWEQAAGPPATLSSRTRSSTHFTAAAPGTFTFVLTGYNSQGVAATDSVTVVQVGSAPPTPPAGPLSSFIRGNRRRPNKDRSGCQVEWLVASGTQSIDRYGLASQKQLCVDGDPGCDFSPQAAGLCEFHVQVCFNNVDPALPACTPSGIGMVKVLAPRLRRRRSDDSDIVAANLEALQNALTHLGDPRGREAGYVYAPPLDATQQGYCSAPFAIAARATARRNRPAVVLKTRSADGSQPPRHFSLSQLRLTCTTQAE
jgi:K319L-like, PKD domain